MSLRTEVFISENQSTGAPAGKANDPRRPRDTPLHVAAASGHTQMVRLLAGMGLPLNEPGAEGLTPVALARRGGHHDTVHALGCLGAEIASGSGRHSA